MTLSPLITNAMVTEAMHENLHRSPVGSIDQGGRPIRVSAAGLLYVVDGGFSWHVTPCCYDRVTGNLDEGDIICATCWWTVDSVLDSTPVPGDFDGVYVGRLDPNYGDVHAWRHAACGRTSLDLSGGSAPGDVHAEHAEHAANCS